MGGRGKFAKDAEAFTPGYPLMPIKRIKFALNFLIRDQVRSKVFERHLASYWYFKMFPSKVQPSDKALELSSLEDITLGRKSLLLKNAPMKEILAS